MLINGEPSIFVMDHDMGWTAMVCNASILSVGLDTYGFDFAPFCRLILIFRVAGRDCQKLWKAWNKWRNVAAPQAVEVCTIQESLARSLR